MVPAMTELGRGCAFAPRCTRTMDKCRAKAPPVFDAGGGHRAACWLIEEEGRR
jgi:oligopeptide/dipeptide ABC transporter ATP-binding protein